MFFFFNDTATTEIYTLSLHDALPIWVDHHLARERQAVGIAAALVPPPAVEVRPRHDLGRDAGVVEVEQRLVVDRKSTRLNSSHANISYAVFCLKKKKTN